MKKSILALIAALVLTVAAGSYLQAQHKGHGMGDGKGDGRGCGMCMQDGHYMLPGHIGFLKQELNLTDDQIEKTLNLNAQYMFKMYKERENKDKVEALRNERQAEFQKLLTPEQNEKYKKLLENKKDMGRGKGKEGMGDCPGCF